MYDMVKISLKAARESRDLTREEIAKCCGITVDAVRVYEKNPGEIPKSIACKAKKAFGICWDEIDLKN